MKSSRHHPLGNYTRKSYTPHSNNILTRESDYGDYFKEFKNPINPEEIARMVDVAINKHAPKTWNKQQKLVSSTPPVNMAELHRNARLWNPSPKNAWHPSHFQNVSKVEQLAYKDSLNIQLKAAEEVTDDDEKAFEFNVKLLEALDAERNNNTMTDAIINMLERIQRTGVISNGEKALMRRSSRLNLDDLSDYYTEQELIKLQQLQPEKRYYKKDIPEKTYKTELERFETIQKELDIDQIKEKLIKLAVSKGLNVPDVNSMFDQPQKALRTIKNTFMPHLLMPKYSKKHLELRDKQIEGQLIDKTKDFHNLLVKLSASRDPKRFEKFINIQLKESFKKNTNYLYRGKRVPASFFLNASLGYMKALGGRNYKKKISYPIHSNYNKEAFMYGYKILHGIDTFDNKNNTVALDKYHNYAPIKLNNGDVITSIGRRVPARYMLTMRWFEYSSEKEILDNQIAPILSLYLKKDESMTSFNIKPSKIETVRDDYGYFKNLEGESRNSNIMYLNDNSYQATGEILGAYIDRWMPELYGDNNYKQEDIDKNFALMAQMFHQEEKSYGPIPNAVIEDWGYGMIAHNHMWYEYLKKEPEYSGKFSLLKSSLYADMKKKRPAEWDKTKYYFNSLKNKIDKYLP